MAVPMITKDDTSTLLWSSLDFPASKMNTMESDCIAVSKGTLLKVTELATPRIVQRYN